MENPLRTFWTIAIWLPTHFLPSYENLRYIIHVTAIHGKSLSICAVEEGLVLPIQFLDSFTIESSIFTILQWLMTNSRYYLGHLIVTFSTFI